jgi:hypothetical protein
MDAPASAGDALVAALPRARDGRASLYEFSVRVGADGLSRRGRFGAWLIGESGRDFAPIADWLEQHDAPPDVRRAQSEIGLAERQGVAVAIEEGRSEFRLYVQSRHTLTGQADYRAWRWSRGEPARHAVYEFHFAPESAAGERPERIVPGWARAGAESLAAEPLYRKSGGFWLRRDPQGGIDQVDLGFPWGPRASSLRGLMLLLDRFALTGVERNWIESLPLRHAAFKPVGAESITLYSSASLEAAPMTEAELQEEVISSAQRDGALMRVAIAALPDCSSANESEIDLDGFYSGEIDLWREVLGPEMHYHHGLFEPDQKRPDDAAMLAASRRAVRELYEFIPSGARVYDIGCGWGGPLAMLAGERGCRALGITVAREQFRHIAAMGLPVRWGDAESTLPPGLFDCALLLESFEHMREKERLLATLRPFTRRLVMRVNCQDEAPPGLSFGGTMHMISSAMLRGMLERGGWRIIHWRDCRAEAMPSVSVWGKRLAELGRTEDKHIEVMRGWCLKLLLLGEEWARRNPLIEAVAERA